MAALLRILLILGITLLSPAGAALAGKLSAGAEAARVAAGDAVQVTAAGEAEREAKRPGKPMCPKLAAGMKLCSGFLDLANGLPLAAPACVKIAAWPCGAARLRGWIAPPPTEPPRLV